MISSFIYYYRKVLICDIYFRDCIIKIKIFINNTVKFCNIIFKYFISNIFKSLFLINFRLL